MPDDVLTDLEICLAVLNGVPSYADLAGPDRIIAADRCVAEAQRRKSLWWAVGLLTETAKHSAEFGRAGAGVQVDVLRQNLRRLGIEPWESEINVR